MSEVVSKISDEQKSVYFASSHSQYNTKGEQNHLSQKLSAGSDMDLNST